MNVIKLIFSFLVFSASPSDSTVVSHRQEFAHLKRRLQLNVGRLFADVVDNVVVAVAGNIAYLTLFDVIYASA
jgi:hypothetical protein